MCGAPGMRRSRLCLLDYTFRPYQASIQVDVFPSSCQQSYLGICTLGVALLNAAALLKPSRGAGAGFSNKAFVGMILEDMLEPTLELDGVRVRGVTPCLGVAPPTAFCCLNASAGGGTVAGGGGGGGGGT